MYKDPQELLIVLNNTLKQNNIEMTLGFIIGMLESADVYLNEDIIKKYIDKQHNEKHKTPADISKMNYGQLFIYKYDMQKYEYEPYTLYYYKKSINILKRKCFKFIKLIESIVNKDTKKEVLEQYDITIDSEGNILGSDILRIVNPFLYNLYSLINKTVEANELDSYINHKINKSILTIEGIEESDIFPDEELQPKDIHKIPVKSNQYIPFTNKQKIARENEIVDEFGRTMSYVDDLMGINDDILMKGSR